MARRAQRGARDVGKGKGIRCRGVLKGEKRPADMIGNAVHVIQIATEEVEEDRGTAPKRAKGVARAAKPAHAVSPPERRSEIAHAAAAAWKKRQGQKSARFNSSNTDGLPCYTSWRN
jgi:hypothetical protein